MKAFIAYRHTREKPSDLARLLGAVRDALSYMGIGTYATFFEENTKSMRAADVMRHGFAELDRADFLLVLQNREERSEGMLLEVDYALAKGIPILVAVQQDVAARTQLPEIIGKYFQWQDVEDLQAQLARYDFSWVTQAVATQAQLQ